MRVQLTLRSDDADWWEDLREEVADRRDGNEPTNAEMARMMMEQFEPDQRGGLR
jgi:hypothetical protein